MKARHYLAMVASGLAVVCAVGTAYAVGASSADPRPDAMSIRFADNREGIELASQLLWEAKGKGECVDVEILKNDPLPIWLHSCRQHSWGAK